MPMPFTQATVFYPRTQNFLRICAEHDIKFIGASGEHIDRMGDKASAKATMKKAGCAHGARF